MVIMAPSSEDGRGAASHGGRGAAAPEALATRVRDPGYTPTVKHLGALLDLLAGEEEELAHATERAVLRIEARHSPRVVAETLARATDAARPARARLARLASRLAASAAPADATAVRTWLAAALADPDLKTRHVAARALGKLPAPEAGERARIEEALLAAWDASASDQDRRALADGLGKLGSKAARERLASASASGVSARPALMIERGAARESPRAIDPSRAPESPMAMRFHARVGLEAVVAEELTPASTMLSVARGSDAWRPRVAGPGVVDARLSGPLSGALAIRTATHVSFPIDPVPIEGDAVAEAIVRALTTPRALSVFRTFTSTGDAPIRFRLAWTRGGHRRALAWRCAELVSQATRELINDPTESTWEVVVDELPGRVALELVPRGYADERFLYRKATVAASSHPTIAAALARLVPPTARDVVWDPFVGAGAELVERARLGPYASLVGTDIDREALDAARENLAAAGVQAQLERADGTAYHPRGVNVIVTNPPMGRRVQRGGHIELLERLVEHAAEVLLPGGALVWAIPEPQRLHTTAQRVGLVLERAFTVDMGGFPAEMSVHRKPAARRRNR